jgi:hypothetical protein
LVFGLTVTSFLLKFAQLDDPITDSVSAAIITAGD